MNKTRDTTTPSERLGQFGLKPPAKNRNAQALGKLGGLKRTAAQAIARANNGRKSVAKMLATRKAKEAGK